MYVIRFRIGQMNRVKEFNAGTSTGHDIHQLEFMYQASFAGRVHEMSDTYTYLLRKPRNLTTRTNSVGWIGKDGLHGPHMPLILRGVNEH